MLLFLIEHSSTSRLVEPEPIKDVHTEKDEDVSTVPTSSPGKTGKVFLPVE